MDVDEEILIDIGHRLLNFMSNQVFEQVDQSDHWCGTEHHCTSIVYKAIDLTQTAALHYINEYYVFLVRHLFNNTFGYISYAPLKTYFTPGNINNNSNNNNNNNNKTNNNLLSYFILLGRLVRLT